MEDSGQDSVVRPDVEQEMDELEGARGSPKSQVVDRNTRLAKTRSGKVYQVKFTTEGKKERPVGELEAPWFVTLWCG